MLLERQDPGPFFSAEAYPVRYPDVAGAGLNALPAHYEKRLSQFVFVWSESGWAAIHDAGSRPAGMASRVRRQLR